MVLRDAHESSPSDCPYCHRPLRPETPDRQREARPVPTQNDSFVSPEYFRLLKLANDNNDEPQQHSPPSSPTRRLVQPAFSTPNGTPVGSSEDPEFLTSTPAAASRSAGNSIRKEALSPGFFKRFLVEEKVLGSGGKGIVLLVRHELDGVSLGNFACKRVPVGDDHSWLEKVLIEVQLLQKLSHPNLVSYRHVWLEEIKIHRFGPPVICAFILQQYCNAGDLLHFVVGSSQPTSTNEQLKAQARRRSKGESQRPSLRSRKLTFDEIASFFKDIVAGLAHLHEANYIHRDLKPSNCLLNNTGNDLICLISDFGEVQAENVVRKSTGHTGTISYCAPEVLRKDASGNYGNFTTKSDIFSLGMILYFMCFGRLPYTSAENIQEEFEDLDQLRTEISTWSGFREEKKERPDLPDQLYTFLKRLLALDPTERPSAVEVLQAIDSGKGLKMENLSRSGRVGSGLGSSSSSSTRIHSIDSPRPGTPLPGKYQLLPFPNLQRSLQHRTPSHSLISLRRRPARITHLDQVLTPDFQDQRCFSSTTTYTPAPPSAIDNLLPPSSLLAERTKRAQHLDECEPTHPHSLPEESTVPSEGGKYYTAMFAAGYEAMGRVCQSGYCGARFDQQELGYYGSLVRGTYAVYLQCLGRWKVVCWAQLGLVRDLGWGY